MTVTNYLWDEDSYLEEYDDVGTTTAAYTNEPTEFGSVISQRRNSETSFNHYDAQGSTHQLTDQNENVTDTFLYDAWGNEVDRTGTTTAPFRYIGEFGYYFDEETDSYYVRSRVYQPLIGRWWSVDPMGFLDTDNLYTYVNNNPVNRVDLSGYASELSSLFLNGFALGVVKKVTVNTNISIGCSDTCQAQALLFSIKFNDIMDDSFGIDASTPTGIALLANCLGSLSKKMGCKNLRKPGVPKDANRQPLDKCGCITVKAWVEFNVYAGGLVKTFKKSGCSVTADLEDCECGICPKKKKANPKKGECPFIAKKKPEK